MVLQQRSKLAIFFSLLAAVLIAGCSATTSPNNTTQTDGSMIATVNGQAWSSTVVPLVTGGSTAVYDTSSHTLTVVGTNGSLSGTQTITLTLINPKLGQFALGLGNTGSFSNGTPGQNSFVTVGPNAGQVNVTKYDTINHLVSGTFNFTAVQGSNVSNTMTITNGSFVNVSWSVH